MPGRSSTVKEEPNRVGPPPPLLGATGGTVGSAGQDDLVIDPVLGSPVNTHATTSVAEGVHQWEK